jgi:sulfate permease, SulP family
VAVLRVESGLFVASADHVRDAVRAQAVEDVHAIVIDAETVPSIDVTAARMLLALRADLQRDGVELVLARDVGQVRDVLETADEGRPSIPTYRSVREAVEAVGHPSGVMRHHPAST